MLKYNKSRKGLDVCVVLNYLKHYIKLVRKGQEYNLRKNKNFIEGHHVFPKSIYGKNNFIVNFTPKQHFIAHLLLRKIFIKRYGKDNEKTLKMIRALNMMLNSKHHENKSSSRIYSKLRIEYAKSMSGDKNINFANEVHKQRMRDLNPMHNPESVEKIRKQFINKSRPKHIQKILKKCNEKRKIKIESINLTTGIYMEYKSIREAARETNMNYAGIYRCLASENYSCHGYAWRKING